MYKVTIQTTPARESNWSVVTAGTWTPGRPPQLEDHGLSPSVIEALFNVVPSATNESGRNQIQDGGSYYAVVVRRLSNK